MLLKTNFFAYTAILRGRGFCGWACWIAAILDWLPVKKGGSFPHN
ncbi:MAG: 4Fe-4S binding protein [Deltaproteobacteria bacterium]|nr:4Fe-4S binding protein [Deltaproteobacteria bacterium]